MDGLTVALVPGTTSTYRLLGIDELDAEGTYTLTIDASQVHDAFGPGEGQASVSWMIDTTPPRSQVQKLPPETRSLQIHVKVMGRDPDGKGHAGGSGLASYELYVSRDKGPFTLWTTVPADNPNAVFAAERGHEYAFASLARDVAGNLEVKKLRAERRKPSSPI